MVPSDVGGPVRVAAGRGRGPASATLAPTIPPTGRTTVVAEARTTPVAEGRTQLLIDAALS